jgi:hypothetical protein
VGSDAQSDFVLVVEDGRAIRRGVEVAYRDGEVCALGQGVRVGELCVSEDLGRVQPGAAVEIAASEAGPAGRN